MRKLRITMSVFLVIVGIGILMLVLSKDSVVISIGIRSYRGLYQGGLIAEVALVILFLILSLRDARKKNAAKKEEREQSADRQKLGHFRMPSEAWRPRCVRWTAIRSGWQIFLPAIRQARLAIPRRYWIRWNSISAGTSEKYSTI